MASQSTHLARHNAVVIVKDGLDVSFAGYYSFLADPTGAIRIKLSAVAGFQQFRTGDLSGGVKGLEVRHDQSINLAIVNKARAIFKNGYQGQKVTLPLCMDEAQLYPRDIYTAS